MSGYVRIEFAQKFTHPARPVVTRRCERPQAAYRDRAAGRLTAFMALLSAMPLTPERLTRFIRDRRATGTSHRALQDEFRDIWASPAAYLWQAQDIATFLSCHGAPWSLVLPVLIAEHDCGLDKHVSGWQGWHAMTDAHAAVRDVLDQMRHAYEWESGHFENLLDGLLYCLLTEDAFEGWHFGRRSISSAGTSLPWDGRSPRSVDEYGARPGDFHPGMALTFVREVRRYFDEDSQIEDRLGAIERAVCVALGRPINDTRETFDTDDAPRAARRAIPSVGGVSPEWWAHMEADPVTGAAMEDDAEARESEDREAQLADADEAVAAALSSLPAGERDVAEAMLTLHGQGMEPTAPAIADVLGKPRTAAAEAAIRQAKRRMTRNVRALLEPPPEE